MHYAHLQNRTMHAQGAMLQARADRWTAQSDPGGAGGGGRRTHGSHIVCMLPPELCVDLICITIDLALEGAVKIS